MNTERLHTVAIALSEEMTKNNTADKLQALVSALQQVVRQPTAPNQQNLSTALKNMYSAVTTTQSDSFSPAWRQLLHEIDGSELFGARLKANIEDIFSRNQITPAVALEELQQLHQRLQTFKTALEQLTSALRLFKLQGETLSPGECEIGMLIPRLAVDNQLEQLAGELKQLSFILNTLSELSTGRKAELSIKTISSSDLHVYLEATPPFAACLAIAIERIVTMYKQLLEIRKLRSELHKQGVPEDQTSDIEKHANKLIDTGVQKLSLEIVDKFYVGDDTGRKNELIKATRISLNRIANRIDRGFNIEVRAAPIDKDKEGPGNAKVVEQIQMIQTATQGMQFLKLEGEPILRLPEGTDDSKLKQD